MAEREGLPQSITKIHRDVQREGEATGISESLLIEGIEVSPEVVKQRSEPTEPENPRHTHDDEGHTPPTRTDS